jgi:hypothetical protein
MTSEVVEDIKEVVRFLYEVETQVAESHAPSARAIFFITSLPVFLYLNSDDVYRDDQDKLFKLKEGAQIPEGIKLPKNPVWRSKILARAVSLKNMLEAGVSVEVVAVDVHCPFFDGTHAQITPAKGSFLEKHPEKLAVYKMGNTVYDIYKADIPAICYEWSEQSNHSKQYVAVRLFQNGDSNSSDAFEILRNEKASDFIARAERISRWGKCHTNCGKDEDEPPPPECICKPGPKRSIHVYKVG